MRVIILTWEFPPRTVGNLANYVKGLVHELGRNKVETHVVTYHEYLVGRYEEAEGVKVYRIRNPVHTHIGVLTWVLTLNQEVERVAAEIYYNTDRQVNLMDVHDWHFIPAAVTLKKAFALPFLYSVDSLEDHRSHGANSLLNMSIKSIEWLGMYESQRIIVKSEWMLNELIRLYRVPRNKIKVIPTKSATRTRKILETYEECNRRHNL
jgi:glycosyltransferase involved in cell wall biosynthesis